jgi:hypothetical protein
VFRSCFSDDILDIFGHRIEVIVSGHENTSGVLQDWVRSAPQHEEIVLIGLADDDPWLNLAQGIIVVHEHTGLGHVHYGDSADLFVMVERVDPGHVVHPNAGLWILNIPIVLAREAIVVRVQPFDNPPVPSDVTDVGKVLLAIILCNSAFSIVWQLISASVSKNAIGKLGKLGN